MALFQKDAGLVDAALANSTHLQLARGNGAVVIDRCPVLRIRRNSAANLEVGHFDLRRRHAIQSIAIIYVCGALVGLGLIQGLKGGETEKVSILNVKTGRESYQNDWSEIVIHGP